MSNVDALRPEHIAQAAASNDVGRRTAGPLVESRILLPSVFVTLVAVAIAGLSGWGMWRVYMAAPWTRDGAVRVYVVTMAPEVGGRIVTLPVADNQFVRKGDELFEIDPADYRIALDQALALTQRDSATLDYARKNEKRKAVLTKDGWASTDVYQQTTSTVGQSEGAVALDNAAVAKAQLDLKRTVIRSPANGYVTNLLVRLGDYATVGQKVVSVVDTDSFWVDGYFEETALGRIHEGDRANIELMGYSQVVRGHVDSVARGINVPNAQPDQTGLASVNPIFTWVRLAQRVPVQIHIDHVPEGVRLVSGTTASVEIYPESNKLERRTPY